MAKIVFALKYVADDEANDIRTLLEENDIDFYETSVGRWQISLAAIWVHNNEDFLRARALINKDQQQRQLDYRKDNRPNFLIGALAHARQNPVESFFTLVALAFVIGLSVMPFML